MSSIFLRRKVSLSCAIFPEILNDSIYRRRYLVFNIKWDSIKYSKSNGVLYACISRLILKYNLNVFFWLFLDCSLSTRQRILFIFSYPWILNNLGLELLQAKLSSIKFNCIALTLVGLKKLRLTNIWSVCSYNVLLLLNLCLHRQYLPCSDRTELDL